MIPELVFIGLLIAGAGLYFALHQRHNNSPA